MSDPLSNLLLGKQPLSSQVLSSRELGTPSGEIPEPPVDPLIYGLNAASPTETAVRAPGDIWVWDGPSVSFKRYNDNTQIPTIGGGTTERFRVGSYDVARVRLAMVGGIDVSQGDMLWHQNLNGQTNVVQLVSPGTISCPETWELAHNPVEGGDAQDDFGNTWRTGPAYAPDYGAYQEPATTQELTNAVSSGTGGTAVATLNRKPNLMEGVQDAFELNFTGNRYRTWQTPGTHDSGVPLVCSMIMDFDAQATTGKLALRNGTSANELITINFDLTVGSFVLAKGDWCQCRWLKDRVVHITAGGTTQNNNTGATRIRLDMASGHIFTHCVNIAVASYPFQPIPTASTRPPDTRAIISSDYAADWAGRGLNTEGQSLILAESYRHATQNVVLFCWIDSGGKGFPKRRASVSTQITWDWGNGQTAHQEALDLGQNYVPLQASGDWSSGAGTVLHSCQPARTTVQSNGAYRNPTETGATGIYYGGASAVQSPIAVRALAYWNKQGTFDFDALFGPGAHKGLPLL